MERLLILCGVPVSTAINYWTLEPRNEEFI